MGLLLCSVREAFLLEDCGFKSGGGSSNLIRKDLECSR